MVKTTVSLFEILYLMGLEECMLLTHQEVMIMASLLKYLKLYIRIVQP